MTILKAPDQKFRIVGVDTFDGTDWVEKDVVKLSNAKSIANEKGGQMLKYYVYDDKGDCVHSAGTF